MYAAKFLSLLILCFIHGDLCKAQQKTPEKSQKKVHQDIEQYIKNNTVPILSIDPKSDDYEDLAPIAEAIGDSRIVLMGELDHGDAATFLAKSRLVKFLHEKHGFNILALETDFFGLNQGWASVLEDTETMVPFLQDNVLKLWAACSAYNYFLYDYLPAGFRNGSPLQITGIDNQMIYQYSRTNLLKYVDSMIKQLNLPIGTEPNYNKLTRPLFASLINKRWISTTFMPSAGKDGAVATDRWLKVLLQQALTKIDTNDFRIKVIENLIVQNEILRLASHRNLAYQVRDAQMAANIHWLATTKYPKEKIIVWAASAHTQRVKKPFVTMGYALDQKFADKSVIYNLGFTSYSGFAGRLGYEPYAIPKPPAASFESWIDSSYKFAFTDYKKFNENYSLNPPSFRQRDWMHKEKIRSWTTVYDGVFFIREMEACSRE